MRGVMTFVHFAGAMVLIGLFDWCVLWLARVAIKHVQRWVFAVRS